MRDRQDMEKESKALIDKYQAVRHASVEMCRPLSAPEYRLQPVEDVSPPWWNLAHTTWFYALNILRPLRLDVPFTTEYEYKLNSYYHYQGPMLERGRRGLQSRPENQEVFDYRNQVDEKMIKLLRDGPDRPDRRGDNLAFLTTVGVNHEQQHQELFYTEIKQIYFADARSDLLRYQPALTPEESPPADTRSRFLPVDGGSFEFGNLEGDWGWDNEYGIHRRHIEDFSIMDRLVTNAEFLEFIQDNGYGQTLLWLSNGWYEKEKQGWHAPLYWEERNGEWWNYTLAGWRPLALDEPVCHISFYEADAFAQWKAHNSAHGRIRLATEYEWEQAARTSAEPIESGNFIEDHRYHVVGARSSTAGQVRQMFGDVWEWTASHYEPYPRFEPFPGGLVEYNGKFMDNQRVLRGGSWATPRDHIRISYRNFWHPATRFQCTGIRLAMDS